MSSNTKDSLLSRHYIDYVYVPAALLVVGTLIVKKEWAPYSAVLAILLGAYNFWNFREWQIHAPSTKSSVPMRARD
jgi:cytochrome-b5 reductase